MKRMAHSAESPSRSVSEPKEMRRLVADSQSPKVMCFHHTSAIAEQRSRSNRNHDAPLLTLSPPIPITAFQTQVNDRFFYEGGGTPLTEIQRARVLRDYRMILPISSTPRPLQPLPPLVATNKHYKGQTFCQTRRMKLVKPAMLAKNCAARNLSLRSNVSNNSWYEVKKAYDSGTRKSIVSSVN